MGCSLDNLHARVICYGAVQSERHEITPFPEQSYAAGGQRRSEAITRIQNQSIRGFQPAASQQLLIMHSRETKQVFYKLLKT